MSTIFAPGPTNPPVDFDQEVRFAVVMYGGSSLAIYINGVAQELLRLVRATAPKVSGATNGGQALLVDEELCGSERVYRRLGRMLSRQNEPSEDLDETNRDASNHSPIRTRFVVDVLTGTSAGGINAVYLAKSLANNQDMDKLKNLWVTEGDIGALINDAESNEGLLFKDDDPDEPWSLLNSRRMYFALLDALRGMDKDKPACATGESPLVDELDLYVTATDMFGRPIQMRLADDVATEFRHRNVFQFRYRSSRASDIDLNDFVPENNAFLAFVARATSAHQAAFSPVRLSDIDPITKEYPKTYPTGDEHPAEHEKLRAFYRDYLLIRANNACGESAEADTEALAKAFQGVWFVDGGTLDNKPFSFVVGELPLRHADTFVDRKLLYIEPSPEQPEFKNAPEKRPQIVGNALAALSTLPRYETIVEDLTRLLERNRLVERVGHIMREMDIDLIEVPPAPPSPRDKFLDLIKDPKDLEQWLKLKGPSWGSYQRLRAAEVTDDLALLVTRAAGFSEESEESIAIRYLVRDWRASKYDSHMEDGKSSIVQFLVEFDLKWTMRRIRFVLKKLNDLACLDEKDTNARRIAGVPRRQKVCDIWPDKDEEGEFRKAVWKLRSDLNKAYVDLRGQRRKSWSTDETNPFRESIGTLDIGSRNLNELLREQTDNERREKARELLGKALGDEAAALLRKLRGNPQDHAPKSLTRAEAIQDLTDLVKENLTEAINKARDTCSAALRPQEDDAAAVSGLPRWDRFLRETLWYYYVHFDVYDQISYPILYSTGVGEEADVIDVFRVSPEDATALIDESAQFDKKGKNVQKLAGTTLGNFGAFFERSFRINDIMWGRLDGAERVIAALLPSHPALRDRMTKQAHRAIIVEEMMAGANSATLGFVWQALDAWDDGDRRNKFLSQAAEMIPGNSPLIDYLNTLAQGAEPQHLFTEKFLKDYEVNRQFTQVSTLKSAVRINRVLGNMALSYFPADGIGSRKRRLAMLLGKRLHTFTEAAIQPDGPARRTQRWRIIVGYALSLLVLTLVCLPTLVLLGSAAMPWPALGFLVILLITLPFAFFPLGLTAVYHYAWTKLRSKLDEILPRAKHD
jgi:patatin-related protein